MYYVNLIILKETKTCTKSTRNLLDTEASHKPKMRKETLLRFVIRRGILARPDLPSCLLHLLPQETGLPVSIHASISRWWLRPRVEVFRTYGHDLTYEDTFSVTIPYRQHTLCEVVGDVGKISQADVRQVMAFVSKNRDVLVGHWFERPGYADFDLFDKLIKISGRLIL